MFPYRAVAARAPYGVVGEYCPPVIPYVLLFTMTAVRLMFLRAAWMKWLPPMAMASPSPMMTMTWSFGFASLMPVAKVRARPCVV